MNIIYIHKDLFHKRSPVISTVLTIKELGHDVTLITEGISEYWKDELSTKGINYYEIKSNKTNIAISKILSYKLFKYKAYKIIDSLYDRNTLLWIEGAQTIFALGRKLNDYKFNLQIQELHEKFPWQLKAISKVINNAKNVFMPEYNRACIYQCWFKLQKRPIVLPNKPYFIPNHNQLLILQKKYSKELELFKSKKIILYQGHIHKERDLTPFIRAINQLDDDYRLVLLGQDHDMFNSYQKVSNKVVHIDYITAPDYLVFTSACYIGIVSYDPLQLNTAFCAPNKIYELGAFSKPIIGNDIPGLRTILDNKAGILVEDDEFSIINGFKAIEQNYLLYSEGSKHLFDRIDTKEIIKNSFTN